MSYNVAFIFCKDDANRILKVVGYTPESPLLDIHEKLKTAIASLMSVSDCCTSVEPWFLSVCSVTRLSAIIPHPNGSQEFQFTLLPEKQLPDFPSAILDAMTETPTEYVATFSPVTGSPKKIFSP